MMYYQAFVSQQTLCGTFLPKRVLLLTSTHMSMHDKLSKYSLTAAFLLLCQHDLAVACTIAP